MTDRIDLAHRGDNTIFRTGQLVDNSGNGFRMGRKREIFVKHGLVADQRAVFQMSVNSDALT